MIPTIIIVWWITLALAFAMGWCSRPRQSSQPSFGPTFDIHGPRLTAMRETQASGLVERMKQMNEAALEEVER